jgi:hypothetical protein
MTHRHAGARAAAALLAGRGPRLISINQGVRRMIDDAARRQKPGIDSVPEIG